MARKDDLARHLTTYTVLPAGRDLCRTWAEVVFRAKKKGRPIQMADAWIAASALHYDVPLISHNADDYLMVEGLTLLSAL
jgi:predicted nucleic acid-binding protein